MSRLVSSLAVALLVVSLADGFALAADTADQSAATVAVEKLQIAPATVTLRGKESMQQLLVTGYSGSGSAERTTDLTREATFESLQPQVATVDAAGMITAVGNGTATIVASARDLKTQVTVEVSQAEALEAVTLENDVIPILTAHGCNSGACHGKARGQNGFALSLLGFYPDFDHDALALEGRGRRVFPAAPERSLLLTKATAQVPHGGGKRIDLGSRDYEILRRWIAEGLPRRQEGDPEVVRISVEPSERSMVNHAQQQLIVTAHYSDGTSRDVTSSAAFQSNESVIVSVDPRGLMTAGPIPGETAVMARYQGHIAVAEIRIPLPGQVPDELYAKLPRQNFIDGHIWNKLQSLGITPSERADDATFVRRAYTDVIGRLPTAEEARQFLADDSADKRAKLIDYLLEQPEFADFWASKWSDLLIPNPYRVGAKATLNFDAWIRDAFRRDMPYDQFVSELLTAQGSTWRNGATTLFRDRREPDEISTMVSQLFLGVRLDCARCHHHPFEKWGQEHFYSFASYFARIGRKGRGISPPISGSEEILFTASRGEVKHPITGEVMVPTPLEGEPSEIAEGEDPRQALVRWMTADDNPYFATVMANRVWADLMGRGIVEPVDDLRATNPPTNGPLLEALAESFRENQYSIKALVRTICNSYAYGLSSTPNERNVADTRNYSRHYRSQLRAEQLLDAVCDITGVPERFEAMPPGSRAVELWTRRINSLFLDTFGRPDLNQDPPCERVNEPTVTQALHLMNSPGLHTKVTSAEGICRTLAESDRSARQIVEELYLRTYSRYPTDEEYQTVLPLFAERAPQAEAVSAAASEAAEGATIPTAALDPSAATEDGKAAEGAAQGANAAAAQEPPLRESKDPTVRRRAAEDLLWALINTPEFVFQN